MPGTNSRPARTGARPTATAPERVGSLIGGVFGVLYLVVNARAVPSPAAEVLQVLACGAFGGLLLALRRAAPVASDPPPRPGFGLGYWLVVLGELVAGAAGLLVLNGPLDAPHAGVAWISVVVGAHFLALAVVWRERFFERLGGLIAACGAIGLVAAAAGAAEAAVALVAGIVPGVLLLGAAYLGVLRRGR